MPFYWIFDALLGHHWKAFSEGINQGNWGRMMISSWLIEATPIIAKFQCIKIEWANPCLPIQHFLSKNVFLVKFQRRIKLTKPFHWMKLVPIRVDNLTLFGWPNRHNPPSNHLHGMGHLKWTNLGPLLQFNVTSQWGNGVHKEKAFT